MRKKNQSRFNRGLKSCTGKLAIGSAMLAGSLTTSDAAIISSSMATSTTTVESLPATGTAVLDSGTALFNIGLVNTSKGGTNIEARILPPSPANSFGFIATTTTDNNPINLSEGTVLDGTATYSASLGQGNLLSISPSALVGFRFSLDSGTTFLNGWAQIEATASEITVTEWAYEDTGAPIVAGQLAVPEPSSSLLAVVGGMIGLTLRRRTS